MFVPHYFCLFIIVSISCCLFTCLSLFPPHCLLYFCLSISLSALICLCLPICISLSLSWSHSFSVSPFASQFSLSLLVCLTVFLSFICLSHSLISLSVSLSIFSSVCLSHSFCLLLLLNLSQCLSSFLSCSLSSVCPVRVSCIYSSTLYFHSLYVLCISFSLLVPLFLFLLFFLFDYFFV